MAVFQWVLARSRRAVPTGIRATAAVETQVKVAASMRQARARAQERAEHRARGATARAERRARAVAHRVAQRVVPARAARVARAALARAARVALARAAAGTSTGGRAGSSAGGASAGRAGSSAGGASAGAASAGAPSAGGATGDSIPAKPNDCVRLSVNPSWSVIGLKFQPMPATTVYPRAVLVLQLRRQRHGGPHPADYVDAKIQSGANPGCDFFVQFGGGSTTIKVTYYD